VSGANDTRRDELAANGDEGIGLKLEKALPKLDGEEASLTVTHEGDFSISFSKKGLISSSWVLENDAGNAIAVAEGDGTKTLTKNAPRRG